MINEILSDNYYCLGIQTYLFGILVRYIEEDYVKFSIDDFEKMRLAFINTGRPVIQNTFSYDELVDWLNRTSYIISLGNNEYAADMKAIFERFVYTDEEKALIGNDIRQLKTYALFCILNLDIRLTDDELTTSLLRLGLFRK